MNIQEKKLVTHILNFVIRNLQVGLQTFYEKIIRLIFASNEVLPERLNRLNNISGIK